MSSYGHNLVTKCGVQVPKTANIGFFAPKPYLKGVDRDFLFDRKFCLVENDLAFRETHFSQY